MGGVVDFVIEEEKRRDALAQRPKPNTHISRSMVEIVDSLPNQPYKPDLIRVNFHNISEEDIAVGKILFDAYSWVMNVPVVYLNHKKREVTKSDICLPGINYSAHTF